MTPRTALFGSLLIPTLLAAQDVSTPLRIADEKHGIYDNDLLSPEFHRQRREALRTKLPEGGVALFFASPVLNRSNDEDYEYHQDPNFY